MLNEIQKKELDRFEEKFWSGRNAVYVETGPGHMIFARPLVRRYADAYTEKYNSGFGSVSVFEIVLSELLREGKIVEIKSGNESNPTDEIAQAISDYEAGRIPTSVFWKRYRSDAQLRNAYDQFLLGQSTPTAEELTAAGFHSIPARVAQHKLLTDPSFRKNVDRLIAEGKI
jgi:hypothetical protein